MKIVFCLPGKEFSAKFLMCWTALIADCINKGHEITVMQRYSCNIYYVRNMCLGGDILFGENQKPFNGQLDYDYIMWIDSDILFNPEQFQKLLAADKDIVSGLYLMDGGQEYATVQFWDEQFFQKNGNFEFMTPQMINKKTEPFPVVYTGFGFILIKKGIFENMKYPWFRPEYVNIGNCKDFTTEDVAWCREAFRLGYKIFIEPTVIVGHEKTKVY
jgi:GT2 family glycosyltransferase